MILDQQLYESAMEVLEGLGEETMQAILWQMGTKGVKFTSDSFDITIFAMQLQDLFGDGAESLLEEIYQNIVCRMELIEPESSFDSSAALDGRKFAHTSSALKKIRAMFGGDERKMSRNSGYGEDGEKNIK